MTRERQEQPPGRRWKPGRGLTIAGIFIGAFLVLQLAETLWRHFAPPPPKPAVAAPREVDYPYPTVHLDDDVVIVEAAGDRTSIRLEYGDDAEAFTRCLRDGIDGVLDRKADGTTGIEGAPPPTRREIRDKVHEVTRRCIDETNAVAPPPPAEPPLEEPPG